jgi:hypothetical protein
MCIEYLYWKDHIVEKIIEKHGVTPDEVEEVIHEGNPEIRKSGKIRYLVLEEESQGVFVPLTARDMTESEKRAFKKR